MRDTALPGLTAQLNQFTNNLFALSSTPALGTTNSGLGATNDANSFFAAVDTTSGVDNAATIQVNPSLVADPTLLDTNAGVPDPAIAQTLSSNLQGATAFTAAGTLPATNTTLSAYVGADDRHRSVRLRRRHVAGKRSVGAADADAEPVFVGNRRQYR